MIARVGIERSRTGVLFEGEGGTEVGASCARLTAMAGGFWGGFEGGLIMKQARLSSDRTVGRHRPPGPMEFRTVLRRVGWELGLC